MFLEPDGDVKSKAEITIKGIVLVKGNSVVHDNVAVVGNKDPESMGAGSDLHAQCQVGIYIVIGLNHRLIIFNYDGMKAEDLESSSKIDGGVGIIVAFGYCIKVDKSRSCLQTDPVSYPGGNYQLVE
jgi:hypothetical protein